MNVALVIGAILSTLLGVGATLTWMVLIVAVMPNSSPAQEASLWRFFWGVAIGGLTCAAAAITLLIFRRPGFAAGAGALPLIAFIVFFVVALATGW